MPRRWALAAATTLAFWPVAASACDTGPWPLEFKRGTSVQRIHAWGDPLTAAAAMRDISGRTSNVRIVIYNSGVSSPALWEARIAAARSELARFKIPPRAIEVVRVKTRGGMVAGKWIGRTQRRPSSSQRDAAAEPRTMPGIAS